jgi:precorrin-6B C5,15-methyltransferase / cobalt-precorrin-6B C5,C15-methyltransferase
VLSTHGRDPGPVIAAVLACPKAAILTAPGEPAAALAAALLAGGRRVFAAERLGGPGERVCELREGEPWQLADPHVLVAVDEDAAGGPGPGWVAGHRGAPTGWALPEDAFAHRDAMITKAEVRAVVLARLGPGLGRTVWDIGSGSGSVAVECARFGASVVAVESDPAQCARIRQNAAAHGVRIRIAEGRAPGVLAGLADLARPDAVFAGGGDDGTLDGTLRLGQPDRAVVALASVDRVRTVSELLAGHGYTTSGVQLQASRLTPLPGGSLRLAAANPVFIVSGERAGERDRP